MENNISISEYLKDLNENQYIAATSNANQNILVVAGAGTGKTKVLVSRYLYLIKALHVPAERIMAITFTKKAANEMRERIETLTNNSEIDISNNSISTFHSIMLRMLKENYIEAGFSNKDFTILNDKEIERSVETVINDLPEDIKYKINLAEINQEDARFKTENLTKMINNLKSNGISADDFLLINYANYLTKENQEELDDLKNNFKDKDYILEQDKFKKEISLINTYNNTNNELERRFLKIQLFNINSDVNKEKFINFTYDDCLDFYKIYKGYESFCLRENKIDFNDMLLRCYNLLKDNPKILEYYQAKFKYILIDEFQDTNQLQYRWLSLFNTPNNYLFAVGDDDQNIYSFRGAVAKNLLLFEKQYAQNNVIQLNKNYRSNNFILDIANNLISNNKNRLVDKNLQSDLNNIDTANEYLFMDKYQQARGIVEEIKYLVEKNKAKYSDFTILYRINKDANEFEEILKYDNIPYNIVGNFSKFFDSKEIKDILAYLKLMINPYNENYVINRALKTPNRMYDENGDIVLDNTQRDKTLRIGEKFLEKMEILKEEKKHNNLFKTFEYYLKNQKHEGLEYFVNLVKGLHQEYNIYLRSENILRENQAKELNNHIQNLTINLEAIYDDFYNNPLGLKEYKENINNFVKKQQEKFLNHRLLNLPKLIDRLLIRSGLMAYYKEEDAREEQKNNKNKIFRSDNLIEFKNIFQDFIKNDFKFGDKQEEKNDLKETINRFYDDIKLELQEDYKKIKDLDKIQLMTIHAAKGLEFKNVYIINLEQGVFPFGIYKNGGYSVAEQNKIQEDRRLLYVAITRAKQNLTLTHCIDNNKINPNNNSYYKNTPSMFLNEINKEFINYKNLTNSADWQQAFKENLDKYPTSKINDIDILKVK